MAELKEVYHGMQAKGVIVNARLVVQVEIPLIQMHSSEICEIIILPVDLHTGAIIPRFENDFIVYNFETNFYYLMS